MSDRDHLVALIAGVENLIKDEEVPTTDAVLLRLIRTTTALSRTFTLPTEVLAGSPKTCYTIFINTAHMTITFTAEENAAAKITVFEQGIDRDNFDDRELPTDIHLVEYEIDGTLYFDSVRAYKTVDIFDFYYDRINAQGGQVIPSPMDLVVSNPTVHR